jgi:hypothetical protein
MNRNPNPKDPNYYHHSKKKEKLKSQVSQGVAQEPRKFEVLNSNPNTTPKKIP